IADYKTEKEEEFIKVIPQVVAYAAMINTIIGENKKPNIHCMIFNKNSAWKFKPKIINQLP
ncbi:MAG: hypothetical protein ACTSU9_11025, partial [Promethearchaeota archaeon]